MGGGGEAWGVPLRLEMGRIFQREETAFANIWKQRSFKKGFIVLINWVLLQKFYAINDFFIGQGPISVF